MNKRLLILGALAVGFAGTTIAAAEWWLRNNIETVVVEKQVGAERAAQFTTIAVAAEEMRYGTVLDTTLIKEIAWPKDSLPEGAFADAQELLADGRRVALYPIAPNEPILSTKISGSDDKPSLSRILEEGKRAVTISVSTTSGVAGFVTPGDRVDIILVREIDVSEADEGGNWLSPADTRVARERASFSVATTLLADVHVITIDQNVDEANPGPQLAATVTLALTPSQAKTVTAASGAGTLHLHLRRAGDTDVGANPVDPVMLDPLPTAAYDVETDEQPVLPEVELSNKVDIVVRHRDKAVTVSVPAE